MKNLASDILSEIEAAAETLSKSPSTIGRDVGQGGRFYARLKGGARVWPETADNVREKLAAMLREHEQRNRSPSSAPSDVGV